LTFLPAAARSSSLRPDQTLRIKSITAKSWLGSQVTMGLPPVACKFCQYSSKTKDCLQKLTVG
jgi:hypothetical protein